MKYKVLKKQNISSNCLVCGIENDLGLKANFYELENNELVAICDTKEWHQSYPGRMHGGMSAAILDETIGRAISLSNDEIWGVTVSLDIKYKKPVPTDCTIKVVGRIIKENRKLFEGTGEIILPNGEIAVTATGKYMKMPVNKIIENENLLEKEWISVKDEEELNYIEL
ncbi:MAG: PaaI family thioesterase [Paraclostridium sp.]|uniref:Acyl-coenzyme A thioesterase THEM4 n=1 Tax=Paeniclostridium hominis TaxID=2764329 RepID=A0ABR7K2E3_9FIRM|nr:MULTISPECIES: PaaI family thioesterase [Paeniclostridium]MBC6003095.1 PaaI family thioesterase [Paeniclostridium hominis]